MASVPMRTALAASILLLSCGGGETQQEAPPEAAPPAAATISLGDLAGTWNVTAVTETGDTTRSVLIATAETTGWTRTYPGRDPIPLRVTAAGDSIVVVAGPYESVLRPGVQVTTETVWRLAGDSLVGGGVSRFVTTSADSVLRTRSVAKRAS